MKLLNAEIGLKGLGRELVNEGFGDVKVKIQGKEVLCVKSILAHGNKTFKKLLEDEKFSGTLELFESCDIQSFLEIEKYYSGGTMKLSEENVCKILSFCVFYDDSFLLRKCKKYIKNHINETIMMKLFNALQELKCNSLSDLKEITVNYLQRNDELLFQLNIEDLELILSSKNLIIENETWLLNQLIKWKNEMKKQNKEEEELSEEIVKLLKKYIHFEKININELHQEFVNEIKEIISYNNKSNRNNYISINVKEIPNDKIKDIIYKYYIEEDKTIINIEDIEILKNNNIEEIISILLNKDDIKLNEIGLLMISDSKIDYESIKYIFINIFKIVKNKIKGQILLKLLYKYKTNPSDRLLKCLCLFVNEKKHISTIEDLCGKEMIFIILNFQYCLTEETMKLLIDYIREIGLNEEEESSLYQIISDNDIIERILIKEITVFKYTDYTTCYRFYVNEEIYIKPLFDGTYCEFSINPSLPDGMIFDTQTGIIHGKIKKSTGNTKYTIICKNKISEMTFYLFLSFEIVNVYPLGKINVNLLNGSCIAR